MALASSILKDSRIEVVRNPIPDFFFSQKRVSDSKKFKIGFISQDLENPYKGLEVLLKSFNFFSKDFCELIELVLIGKSRKKYKLEKVQITQITISDQIEMAKTISTLNLLVIPSNQDNFPSVIGESLAIGTRVIGSNVGGIAEALNLFSLPTFEPEDSKNLAGLIQAEAKQPKIDVDKKLAYKEFSEKNYAEKMYSLYKSSEESEE